MKTQPLSWRRWQALAHGATVGTRTPTGGGCPQVLAQQGGTGKTACGARGDEIRTFALGCGDRHRQQQLLEEKMFYRGRRCANSDAKKDHISKHPPPHVPRLGRENEVHKRNISGARGCSLAQEQRIAGPRVSSAHDPKRGSRRLLERLANKQPEKPPISRQTRRSAREKERLEAGSYPPLRAS